MTKDGDVAPEGEHDPQTFQSADVERPTETETSAPASLLPNSLDVLSSGESQGAVSTSHTQQPQSSESPDESIIINIKQINKPSFSLSVPTHTTVGDFKRLIEEQSEVVAARQRLIYTGKVMKNEKRLEDYNIQNGQTVHLVTRPEGAPSASNGDENMPAVEEAAGAPQIQFQNVGNGVVMGTLSVDQDQLSDLPNILGGIFNTLGVTPTPETTAATTSTNTSQIPTTVTGVQAQINLVPANVQQIHQQFHQRIQQGNLTPQAMHQLHHNMHIQLQNAMQHQTRSQMPQPQQNSSQRNATVPAQAEPAARRVPEHPHPSPTAVDRTYGHIVNDQINDTAVGRLISEAASLQGFLTATISMRDSTMVRDQGSTLGHALISIARNMETAASRVFDAAVIALDEASLNPANRATAQDSFRRLGLLTSLLGRQITDLGTTLLSLPLNAYTSQPILSSHASLTELQTPFTEQASTSAERAFTTGQISMNTSGQPLWMDRDSFRHQVELSTTMIGQLPELTFFTPGSSTSARNINALSSVLLDTHNLLRSLSIPVLQFGIAVVGHRVNSTDASQEWRNLEQYRHQLIPILISVGGAISQVGSALQQVLLLLPTGITFPFGQTQPLPALPYVVYTQPLGSHTINSTGHQSTPSQPVGNVRVTQPIQLTPTPPQQQPNTSRSVPSTPANLSSPPIANNIPPPAIGNPLFGLLSSLSGAQQGGGNGTAAISGEGIMSGLAPVLQNISMAIMHHHAQGQGTAGGSNSNSGPQDRNMVDNEPPE